ncbi:16S rRNA (cytosine(1402)-N(4))-methyltransferase RsmH [Sciscionella marina]|uniref:16S rRNA (cytosine(1402)-N(4))-methyltransferase RsmH n=1 Tax=Sciscionella marina TaxID=508770 RepID=UPI00037F5E13
MTGYTHEPVLLERVLELFEPALDEPGALLVDCTLGLGGHTEALLERFPGLTVFGVDQDMSALERARARLAGFGARFQGVHARFDEFGRVAEEAGRTGNELRGVLFDLGVSSLQLDAAERGFAYAKDAALDMRMDPEQGITAAEVLNTYPHGELARILREYGEERFAGKIASAVLAERERAPFETSARLVELLYRVLPAASRRSGGHPAKRTFQALRIEVNAELEVLRTALPAALDALAPGGRIVVESYHSLEDRIVKRELAGRARSRTPEGLPVELPGHGPSLRLVTRGAEQAGEQECAHNPRAASVRLRAAEKLPESGKAR